MLVLKMHNTRNIVARLDTKGRAGDTIINNGYVFVLRKLLPTINQVYLQ